MKGIYVKFPSLQIAVRSVGMSFLGNTCKNRLSRGVTMKVKSLAAAALCCSFVASPVMAQQGPVDIQEQEEELMAPFVDSSNAIQAYRLVNNWLMERMVPEKNFELPRINVTNLVGIRVTLRQNGKTIGEGTSVRNDIDMVVDNPGETIDMVSLLANAARDAFSSAKGKLISDKVDAISKGWISGNSSENTFDDVADDLLIDIQMAHNLQSVNLAGLKMPESIYYSFAPGYHGLRLINPEAVGTAQGEAYVWPATALSFNVPGSLQISRMLTEMRLPLTEKKAIGQQDGLQFQKFDVIHFVKPQADLDPVLLVRGNKLLPAYGLDDNQLRDLSDRLLSYIGKLYTNEQTLRGDYLPTTNLYKPALARDDQALLACYAVLKYHQFLLDNNLNYEKADQLADEAGNIVETIAEKLAAKDAKVSPVNLSLAVMGIINSPRASVLGSLRDVLSEKLLAHMMDNGGFRNKPDEKSPYVNQPTQALAVAAVASLYKYKRTESLRMLTLKSLENLWLRAEKRPDLTALYWMANAHSQISTIINPKNEPKLRIALNDREQTIGKAIETLLGKQIIAPPENGPADVVGGFELQNIPLDAAPTPSWHTSQILALISTGLREPGMKTNHDSFGWLLAASLGARFIDQLALEPDSCYYLPNAERAVNGVRISLTNNRLSVAPSAMSLIACTELMETLQTLRSE